MWYKDIEYLGEKYRGVYFTSYRPNRTTAASTEGNSAQDNNGFLINTIYWFKWERVKWDVMKSEDNKLFIISNLILDSQDFNYTDTRSSEMPIPNKYEISHIREWLSNNFYNECFTSLEKERVQVTTVGNGKYYAGYDHYYVQYEYDSDNTEETIFLLSNLEAKNMGIYVYDSSNRISQGTDYALCQGLSNPYWWLRSPCFESEEDGVFYCTPTGDLCSPNNAPISFNVTKTTMGVRPAMWISL